MRALLVSHGSTGDIFPLIGLGRALKAAGHTVTFATASLHAPEVRAAGLDFAVAPPDWSAEEHAALMRRLARERYPWRNVSTIYGLSAPHLGEFVDAVDALLAGHDLLVASYLYPFLRDVAHRRGKPFALAAFCHAGFGDAEDPPPPVPALSFLPAPCRHAWADAWLRAAEAVVGVCVRRACGDELRRLGLRLPDRFFHGAADLTLAVVSPGLYRTGRPMPAGLRYTGYLRFTPPESEELEARLRAFTGGERVPVINFGSLTVDDAAARMTRFLAAWPRGRKLILQSGWAGFAAAGRDDVCVISGKVSHPQLFRYASVVAHHGGAGTTAAVLHAGVPHVVVPHLGDQFFWAAEVRRLGVGRSVSAARWPERLPEALLATASDAGACEAARRCAGVLATEDGAAAAVGTLEALVAKFPAGAVSPAV